VRYRRLNKRYYGLLDFIVPAHFIGQIGIMWCMLKGKPRNEQTYEQIKTAITIPSLRKRLTPRTTVEKSVVNAGSKPFVVQSIGNKFTERSKEIQRKRAGYQAKNYFRKIAEYR